MSLLNAAKPGTPVFWGIGNRATGQFDEHPGILLKEPYFGQDDRGREGIVAFVMFYRHNLAGEAYLQPSRILETWIDDRDWVVPELDESTPEDLMKQYGAQRRDFFTSGAAQITVGATVEAKATKGTKAQVAETDSPELPV